MPDGPSGARRLGTALRILAVLVGVKLFLLDTVAVRTRSMDPTIAARADRAESVVIDRTAAWRTPQRFDVALFRYPNHAPTAFLKRIVGLPGETVALARGGAWRVRTPYEPLDLEALWRAGAVEPLRKPRELTDAFLARLPVVDPIDLRGFTATSFDRLYLTAPEVRPRLVFADDFALEMSETSESLIRFRKSPTDALADVAARLEGREPSVPETGGDRFVWGVAVGAEIRADADASVVFHIDLPDASGAVRATLTPGGDATLAVDGTIVARTRCPDITGASTRVRLDTCDMTATLRVDGGDILAHPLSVVPKSGEPTRGASAGFGVARGRCRFRRPIYARDLHWRAEGLSWFDVPKDAVMVLGDHPIASADSRHFRSVTVRDLRDGTLRVGDARTRTGSPESETPNPHTRDAETSTFIDVSGVAHTAPSGTFEVVGSTVTPFVPLADLKGRAVAVLWPPSHVGPIR